MRHWYLLLLITSLACTGSIADPDNDTDGPIITRRDPDDPLNPETPPEEIIEDQCQDVLPNVGANALKRLNQYEYDQTAKHLFGITSTPAAEFTKDDNRDGFRFGGVVSPLLAEQYMSSAVSLSKEDLQALSPCQISEGAACADQFIETFGRRAFRRDLTTEEKEKFGAIFNAANNSQEGFEYVVQALISSPHFIYHHESLPTGDDAVPLDGYSVASRLSYFMWSSMPDDTLLDEARDGVLVDQGGVEDAARRMTADDKLKEGMRLFFRQWFGVEDLVGVEKDPTLYPEWWIQEGDALVPNEAFRNDLLESFDLFVAHVMFEEQGSLEVLFTANYVFVNERLAPLFGLTDITGDEFRKVDLPTTRRAGVLTHPAVMAKVAKNNGSDPINRGLWVRHKILCQELPAPPVDVEFLVPDPAPGLTTRERFAMHTSDEGCATCHRLIDGLGLTFEHYDGIGAWRDTDQDLPIDSSGAIVDTLDADGAVADAVDMAAKLALSEEVRTCAVRQMFRYATRRHESEEDVCSLAYIRQDFTASQYNLVELMIAITRSDAFRYNRAPGVEE